MHIDDVAREYVQLCLELDQHVPGFVDAYFGPDEFKTRAAADSRSPEMLHFHAKALSEAEWQPTDDVDEAEHKLREGFLRVQLSAVSARAGMVFAPEVPFDEESVLLFDVCMPPAPEAEWARARRQLESIVPGSGPLAARYAAFRSKFSIPNDRVGQVFEAAIAECRSRTIAHIPLPSGERYDVEFVRGKSWSGYNWYQGSAHSVMQINADLPSFIDRAVDLAGHEGYPGHHAAHAVADVYLVQGLQWMEHSLIALFTPQCLLSEGTANFGVELAFPGEERTEFEAAVLFPLAGLDPAEAGRYYQVQTLLGYTEDAVAEVARRVVNDDLSDEQAVEQMMEWCVLTPEQARQRLAFIREYRSYVITYSIGPRLVREFVNERAGVVDSAHRWTAFADLLRSPRRPAQLRT